MSIKQLTLKRFLNIGNDDDSDEVSAYTPSPEKSKNTIPPQWTRVKNVDQVVDRRITVFDVEKDMASDKSLQAIRKGAVRDETVMLFDPSEYQGMGDKLTMAEFAVDHEQLLEYAKVASEIRARFKEKARAVTDALGPDDDDEDDELEEIKTDRQRAYTRHRVEQAKSEPLTGPATNSGKPKRKRRRLPQLASETRF